MITIYQKDLPKNACDILFTSDWHLFHNKSFLFGPRGFATEEEHTERIMAEARKLTEGQTLFFLGDFALNVLDRGDILRDFLEDLKCQVYMLWGNHNSFVFQEYRRALDVLLNSDAGRFVPSPEFYPIKIAKNVTILGDTAKLKISKREIYHLNHFPQIVWDGINRGSHFICGHCHGNLEGINFGRSDIGKIFDVGIENGQKHNGAHAPFFTLDDIRYVMSYKKIRNTESNTH
jgi:calcineurin-like phosphoesterase family protein